MITKLHCQSFSEPEDIPLEILYEDQYLVARARIASPLDSSCMLPERSTTVWPSPTPGTDRDPSGALGHQEPKLPTGVAGDTS